jgi:ABC-type ATPase with predicted acetyltransferase domain
MKFETPLPFKLNENVLANLKNLDLQLTSFSELLEVEDVEAREEKLGSRLRFRINIRYRTRVQVTPRTIAVAEAFGIPIGESQEFIVYNNLELLIGEEDIVYITGDSGSGKSALLRAIEKILGSKAKNINDVEIDEEKPLIETVGKNVNDGLELLSRVGLNDAFLFVRKYSELSDGQKYRYKLAKLIESDAQFWIADEFCSTLDRDTAKIVAFNVQKLARELRKGLIVATCNQDLFEDLGPTVYIVKYFGQEVKVSYFPSQAPKECSLVKEMKVVEGTIEDYKKLAHFHYRSSHLVAPKRIFTLKRKNEVVGVIVYARPPFICFGRAKYFGRALSVKELNEKLLTITRIIVHPKYRTIGLGVKLLRETLPLAGKPYVEMIAVMARYNPFAEKAGMIKVAEKERDKKLLKFQEYLESLGFNRYLLSSASYNISKLRKLSKRQIENVKKALVECHHFFLLKNVLSDEEYRLENEEKKWKICARKIKKIRIERLAKLLSIVARLLQVKVYLIWKREGNETNVSAQKR